ELEKWNIEKRLSQERQSARERLIDRDQQITKLNEQLAKLQSLMAKMERKLIARKEKQTPKIETEDRSVQTLDDQSHEQQSNRSVRFQVQREQQPLQHSSSKKKIIKPDIRTNMLITDELEKSNKNRKPMSTKKLLRPEIQSIADLDDKQIDQQFNSVKELSSFQMNVNDLDRIEISSETAVAVEDVDSSREIVIHPIDRDHRSTIINEIAIVDRMTPMMDNDITLMNQIKKIGQRIKKSSSTSSSMATTSSSPSSSSSMKSIILKEINSYHFDDKADNDVHMNENQLQTSNSCRDCESKLQAHRIEQQLIDLRLERLLDQNIGRLKSSLNIVEASIHSAKRKSNHHDHYDHTELDCDQIYE
ncbi:hypothetical protein BLA29_006834, partial [Euroglyphus maynei]